MIFIVESGVSQRLSFASFLLASCSLQRLGLTHNTQLKFAKAQDRITASGLVWPAASALAVLIYPALP